MDSKRATAPKKTPAPILKSRYASSLKPKGHVTSSTTKSGIKASTPSKSSFLSNRESSEVPRTLHSAAKSSRYKSQTNLKELTGELNNEEASQEATDIDFQFFMASNAARVLLEKAEHRIRGDVDKQIAGLQKRVNENLSALEETRLRVNKVEILQGQRNLLSHHGDVCQAFSNEPVFAEGKSFEELMTEIDRIKNQLPCKHVSIPETSADLAEFQNATSHLLDSLECISSVYGSDQIPISLAVSKLDSIDKCEELLKSSKLSLDTISPKASMSVLNEAILKTSKQSF